MDPTVINVLIMKSSPPLVPTSVPPNLIRDLQLSELEVPQLAVILRERYLHGHELLLSPEHENQDLFFLMSGKLLVSGSQDPNAPLLSQIEAPAWVGETSSVLGEKPVAFVIAGEQGAQVLALNLQQVRALGYRELENKFLRFATRSLTAKIQSGNAQLIRSLEDRVKSLEERRRQSIFMTQIFVGLSIYLFSQSAVQPLNDILPADTLISAGVIVGFLLALIYSIKKSHAPLKSYGLHLETWKTDALQAVGVTLPILLLAFVAKYIWVKMDPSGQMQWIQPEAIFARAEDFSWGLWSVAALAYGVLSVAQEMIGRSGIQCTLRNLFVEDEQTPDQKRRAEWKAIWVSSLLFSATHIHLGATFSAIVFVPGVFWAWMFSRQGSIVGTSVSHILLGLGIVFVLGLPV